MTLRPIEFPTERGVLADEMPDCVYHIPRSGQVYTTPFMSGEVSLRFYCVVAVSARGAPFKLGVKDRIDHMEAVALKAMVDRGVYAKKNVRLVSCQIDPRYPLYRSFLAIPAPGLLPLNRDAFASLENSLEAAYRGQLTIEEATALFNNVVQIATQSLPPPPPLDKRVGQVMKMLRENSNVALADLAKAVGLSNDRLSHLFVKSMGLPLKSYQLWQKLHSAVNLLPSGRSLTQIAEVAGFTDSAHLSKTFQQVYGAPPSYFLDTSKVRHIAPAKG